MKITAVSYLNTKPFIYGLIESPLADKIDIQLDIPSACASKIMNNEVDFGLVPIGILPEIGEYHIFSDYCIGSIEKVKTVCIFSDVPIEEIETLILDFHSRTSVRLAQVLLDKHWKLSPNLIAGKPGFENDIQSKTAAVVIGDRAIHLSGKFKFEYDLGEEWYNFTGLPFVFAAWVSKKELDPDFITIFNQALRQGIERIPQLCMLIPKPTSDFDLYTYYTEFISYKLDDEKRKGLELFLSYLANSEGVLNYR